MGEQKARIARKLIESVAKSSIAPVTEQDDKEALRSVMRLTKAARKIIKGELSDIVDDIVLIVKPTGLSGTPSIRPQTGDVVAAYHKLKKALDRLDSSAFSNIHR
jgi:hypothetical protein